MIFPSRFPRRYRWSEWAGQCIAAIGEPSTEEQREALEAFRQVERLGFEPYWSLKAYAVLTLKIDTDD